VRRGLAAWDRLADVVAVCIGPGPLDTVLTTVAAAAPQPTPPIVAASISAPKETTRGLQDARR
jgi:hypothetical protein